MTVLNFNLGILGHVDSGKTSLAKALSKIESTACFDKNPQSKERGITLDLGFSSFTTDFPEHLKSNNPCGYTKLQFTLVDCPGHASLIKTIIGGAQIIDMMILVIDITKGMQTQTAECLIIGEITCNKMLVVLNKIDLIPIEKRQLTIAKMQKKIQATLKLTKFSEALIIPASTKEEIDSENGIKELLDALTRSVYLPNRDGKSSAFLFAVDHCFAIRGQGTVLTGTILQGKVSVNDSIEIPLLKLVRKVKSMQMFHKSVESASQGDRLGICVNQFDAQLLERGIVCAPNYLPTAYGLVVALEKLKYFKQPIKNKMKYHISLGHETVMAKVHLFESSVSAKFNFDFEYRHVNEITDETTELKKTDECHYLAVLELDHPIPIIPNGILIGSKFDSDIHSNKCRIAFKGIIQHVFEKENLSSDMAPLKVFKTKQREGVIERMSSPYEIIGKNLFKKETNLQPFVNLKVLLSTGETGFIESSFGQSGKVKIRIADGLKDTTQALLVGLNKKKKTLATNTIEEKVELVKIILSFKHYIYDPSKKMIQT